MMIMNRLFLTAICLLATITLFTACSEDDDSQMFETTVSISASSGTEGQSNGVITLTLGETNASGDPITFNIIGQASEDFTFESQVSIDEGVSSIEMAIEVVDDGLIEGPETFEFSLPQELPDGITLEGSASVSLIIEDNDEREISLSSARNRIEEGQTGGFQISLDQPNPQDGALEIEYSVSGDALSETDFNPLPGTASIPSGGSSVVVEITSIDDEVVETTESVIITLSSELIPGLTLGEESEVSVMITDNDATTFESSVSITSSDTEGKEGDNDASFTISLGMINNSGMAFSIPVALSGSATEGADFNAISRSVEIEDGAQTGDVTINIIDDDIHEVNETVIVALDASNLPNGISLGENTEVRLTIVDNDESFEAVATISASDDSGKEGDNNAAFTVSLNSENTSGETLTLGYTVTGSATEGSDYSELPGVIQIAESASSAEISIDILEDQEDEEDETVIITLNTSNLPDGVTIGSESSATVTIEDNDETAFTASVSISSEDRTATENNDDASFILALDVDNTSGSSLEIAYEVSGTATSGSDYTELSGMATIEENDSFVEITLNTLDDDEVESEETVIITLSSTQTSGITLGNSTEITLTINDDDEQPSGEVTLSFGTSTGSTITIDNWTEATNASGYVIVMNTIDSFTDLSDESPAGSVTYIGTDEQVVYNGDDPTTLTIQLLEDKRDYYFKAFPYNSAGVYDNDQASTVTSTTACSTDGDTETEVCFTIDDSGDIRLIESNQIPDHDTGKFPNASVTATANSVEMDLTPSTAESITYVYDDQEPLPRLQNFYKFGIATNGIGYNPMGLKPFTNPDTGEENWDWQAAVVNEGDTDLDAYGGHVTSQGVYHYHGDILGHADQEDGSRHSLIYGWAADGFPIYYKYAYADAYDNTSDIKELKSSWQLKEGNRPGDGTSAPDGEYDGTYIQDYEYVEGLGDLDECNGRTGVTPEYPEGTYYYVVTADFPKVPNCFNGTPSDDFLVVGG